jgi:uncharacterized membrane protein HdeD (DUF308 family)
MTNRQWRVAFGAINAGLAFLLVQQPVQDIPLLAIVIGTAVSVIGFLRAPDDQPV